MHDCAIILFARHPTPGQVKTRLASTVGDAAATSFYRNCAELVIAECASVSDADCYVFFASAAEEHKVVEWLGPTFPSVQYVAQLQHPDLGARLAHALQHALALGHTQAIIAGTDVPDLSVDVIRHAFSQLQGGRDVVFGPAEDGGYYLVGVASPACPPAVTTSLFAGIAWSTAEVLQQNLGNAAQLGLKVAHLGALPTLPDIDTEADLGRWVAATRHRKGSCRPQTLRLLSIVEPLLQRGQHHPDNT